MGHLCMSPRALSFATRRENAENVLGGLFIAKFSTGRRIRRRDVILRLNGLAKLKDDESLMTTGDEMQPENKQCPYWAKDNSHECRMTKGGLYIPMPEHVEMFCSTAKYVVCPQHVRGCELLQEAARKYGYVTDGGRRRFRRVDDHRPVKVSLCDQERRPLELLDENAVTIDLSLGGMRVQSHKELPRDAFICFEFDAGFTVPALAGVGEVKWCEASRNGAPHFEAGVAFTDSRLTQAIGAHLGLPM